MSLSNNLKNFIAEFTGNNIFTYSPLKKGFSERNIFRINSGNSSFIAVESDIIPENTAFLEFTKSFKKLDLKVPDILKISSDKSIYLISDLGEKTLFDFINVNIDKRDLLLYYYRKALNDLFIFQSSGNLVIDYGYCYQTASFDFEQITADESKFIKYYGQYLPGFSYDLFLNSFNILNRYLISENDRYFMYRDFQPRNIIINDNELFYIDYQSGRKGPLQYDVASFLYSGSIDITKDERNILLGYYTDILKKENIDSDNFLKTFNYFVIIRLLQMIGSYAYQISEKKTTPYYFYAKIKKVIIHLQNMKGLISDKEIQIMLEKLIFIHI